MHVFAPHKLLIAACAALLLVPQARAATSMPATAAAAAPATCQSAGDAAERAWSIPTGLLAAIGRMESGRYDAATGRIAAWPFTINAAGTGHFYRTADDAITAVQDLQMRGIGLIDVGCFQVNLLYHPGAFATLADGFDPQHNADYAAAFLSRLYRRTGSWEAAVAAYHSATPGLGEPYRDRVLADWQSGGLALPHRYAAIGFSHPGGGSLAGDPYVIHIAAWAPAQQAALPRVWRPGAAAPAPAHPRAPRAGQGAMASPVMRHFARLPRIITPGS
ncbi:MAG: transglycosylase SLT domain-containing protein [Rhodospirillales bacterium]|nr:transglycosylase SLT domain-containing protein [Rhodospirillales bacterium]